MKTKCLLSFLILSFFVYSMSFGQAENTVIAKAYYKFTHQRDTIDLSRTSVDQMVLLLSPTSSVYKSYMRMVHDSIMLANIEKMKNNQIMGTGNPGTGTQIYFFQKPAKSYQFSVLVKNYVYEIPTPKINWEILPDTMTIAGLKCQKASGSWMGRIYDVWFCPELPFNVGPWKLVGLPGLILNAEDRKKQVLFEFAGFTKVQAGNEVIAIPKSHIVTTKEDFAKMENAFLDDPISYMKALMPEIQEITPPNKYVRRPPINNPIEIQHK